MVYNNVTDTLRKQCGDMVQRYYDAYGNRPTRSAGFLSYLAAAELGYKLGTLIDTDHPSFSEYQKAVHELLPVHIDPTLKKELGRIERYHVKAVESEFCEFMASVSPDCPSPNVPYCRIIRGREAEAIADRFYEAWGYDTTYWYPLNNMSGEDKLFISPKRIEPYLQEINTLLGLPREHVYEYGEAWYDRPHCAEVDELENDPQREIAYCPKDFSWIIYYSHENTVSFAGTIVPKIKEILHAQREHWNRYEWSD